MTNTTTEATPAKFPIREWVSALADGQAGGNDQSTTLLAIYNDEELLTQWDNIHWVGDILRSPEALPTSCDGAFLARFRARLAAEPAVLREGGLEHHALVAGPPASPPAVQAVGREEAAPVAQSANDARFRWRWVAGVAGLGLVGVMALNLRSDPSLDGAVSGQISSVQNLPTGLVERNVVVAGAGTQVMIRDPRLDQLLAAHKQFGGTSALQTPAGFLRNATFEETVR